MTHLPRHDRHFDHAEPFLQNRRAAPVVLFRPTPTPKARPLPIERELNWPGWPRWIATGWRLWQSVRRTRIAMDSLSHEQLKDIGFRRAGDTYERMPL